MRRIARAPAFTAAIEVGDSKKDGAYSSPCLIRILTQYAAFAIGKCQNHLRERVGFTLPIVDFQLSIGSNLGKPIDNWQSAIG